MESALNKPPTLQELAATLGMHKSTVSLALSGKGNVSVATRQRVLAAAQELGYEPNPLAQRLARGYQNDVVCLFAGVLDVGLATQKILSIQQRLTERGLDVPIYTASRRPGVDASSQGLQIRQLWRQQPRAILCATPRVETTVFLELEAYQRSGGVVVTYDTPAPLACDQVLFDREESAYAAARYLLERGHRKLGIAMSSVPDPLPDSTSDPIAARMAGFRRALCDFGLPFRDEWFFRNANYERGGAEMAHRFLELKDRPTALCIVNDYVALAFTVEIMHAGVRVPEEVSIISHDNQAIAAYSPVPLTAMTHPAEEIARSVVDLLLDRTQGRIPAGAPPREVRLSGSLVERRSVAALAG